MTETIASAVERFIAHKRAHGRKYHSEARELALLVRFAAEHQVSGLSELTPALLEDFLASRPRSRPRSFNHLLGVMRYLLDWAVTWQLLKASPLQARRPQTQTQPLGPVLHSFFTSHLITVKGLRPASVRSYRDTVRLLLVFIAADKGCKITRLALTDLTFDRIVAFLRHLEHDRGNHARTRNQRLAALHCLFDYIAGREPDMLATCQQVAAIPVKRTAPPETQFLERDEIEDLLRHLPRDGPLALRDRALILFLYNTGARAQEVAGLRTEHLDLGEHPQVRLHGKGGKWRTCPLWQQTARLLTALPGPAGPPAPGAPVFAAHGQPLARYGIYKIIRRHAARFDDPRTGRQVSPHTFRHTAAVHLLEAGVEVNVIRGWLGHADLATTNRYAEINTKTKLAALQAAEPHNVSAGSRTNPIWRSDQSLLNWLASL